MRLGKRCVQGRLVLLGEQRMTRSPMTTLVAHSVGSSLVVAARDPADPIGGVAPHPRNGGSGQPTRQQPEEVPAAALDGIVGLAIALIQFVLGQIRMEADAFWHAPVLQQNPATPYEKMVKVINVWI
jgi:hypothetical protein